MATWRNIDIDRSLIRFQSCKGTLISVPGCLPGHYKAFWHPTKLVRDSYKNPCAVNIGYTDEWEFKLIPSGRTYGEKLMASNSYKNAVARGEGEAYEERISAKEFEEIFLPLQDSIGEPEKDIIHVPEYHAPIENPVACQELTDD